MESQLPLNQRLTGRMKRPKEVVSWSEDENKQVHFDDRALRYYYFPQSRLDREPDINLAHGFNAAKFDPQAGLATYIDRVLSIIIHQEETTGERLNANIVTWRGLLTQLIVLSQAQADPQVLQDSFEYLVTGFDNQIFMSQDDEFVKTAKKSWQTDPHQLRFMYSGFQFEQVATLAKPWGETSRDEIEERYTQGYTPSGSYGILIKSGVGQVDLLYGAETDCVENYKDDNNKLANYVELKTSRCIEYENQARSFEKKLLRTWVQSFLSGVPKIVYGFRDDKLVLRAVEEYKTDDLPKLAKNSIVSKVKWNGNDAIGFYTIVLQWLKDKVEDGKSYRLIYRAKSQQLVLKSVEINVPGREVSFLSNEFVHWRRSRKGQN